MHLSLPRTLTTALAVTLAGAGLVAAHTTAMATQYPPTTGDTTVSTDDGAQTPTSQEGEQALADMREAFATLDDTAASLNPGDFAQVGMYREWPAYAVRTADGAVTVALGNPLVMDRVACPFGTTGMMETLGVAGLDALRTVAPEGAPFIMLTGHTIPLDVADLYIRTGDITAVERELIDRKLC